MAKLLITNKRRALEMFQKRYPSSTSADFQTFLIGYQACMDLVEYANDTQLDVMRSEQNVSEKVFQSLNHIS